MLATKSVPARAMLIRSRNDGVILCHINDVIISKTSYFMSPQATLTFSAPIPAGVKRYDMLLSLDRITSVSLTDSSFGNKNVLNSGGRGMLTSAHGVEIVGNTFHNLCNSNNLLFLNGEFGRAPQLKLLLPSLFSSLSSSFPLVSICILSESLTYIIRTCLHPPPLHIPALTPSYLHRLAMLRPVAKRWLWRIRGLHRRPVRQRRLHCKQHV